MLIDTIFQSNLFFKSLTSTEIRSIIYDIREQRTQTKLE